MEEPIISVAIVSGKKIKFELYGEFTVDGQNKKISGQCNAIYNNNKIELTQNSKFNLLQPEITLTPDDYDLNAFLLYDVQIGSKFHWQRKENQRFLGSLKFIIDNDNITAVNIISIEDYLMSVISSEMSANSSFELLKAQSIISRSWLLAQLEKAKVAQDNKEVYHSENESEDELIKWYDRIEHNLYDVCADDHCQRYQGVTKILSDTAKRAVEMTRGIILKYTDEICDTRYSKCCGGFTESFENVWQNVKYPYLSSVCDYKFEQDGYDLNLAEENAARDWLVGNPPAFCNTSDSEMLSQAMVSYDLETTDFYRWKVEYTQEKIAELIKSNTGKDLGHVMDLIPVERGFSARIIKLKIVGSKKTYTIGKELEIRRVLSPSHLLSSAFVADKFDIKDGIPQRFLLTGAGWGHGVGLCQIGAAVMAGMGYNFDEILLHYFKGAKISKMYE